MNPKNEHDMSPLIFIFANKSINYCAALRFNLSTSVVFGGKSECISVLQAQELSLK